MVIIDEAYIEFSCLPSLADSHVLFEFPNLVVCRTFRWRDHHQPSSHITTHPCFFLLASGPD